MMNRRNLTLKQTLCILDVKEFHPKTNFFAATDGKYDFEKNEKALHEIITSETKNRSENKYDKKLKK